jgi:hypothetical protein
MMDRILTVLASLRQSLVLIRSKVAEVAEMVKADAERRARSEAYDGIS